jgi:hypothetical protein
MAAIACPDGPWCKCIVDNAVAVTRFIPPAPCLRTIYFLPRNAHHVEHYTRVNSAEYFFVYLDDYPDNKPAFDDSGAFNRRPGQSAFDNIFVYNPTDGTLELFAQGGRKVHEELQKRFCGAVLCTQIEPAPPSRPVYQLDHLKNPAFAFPTDPADHIADVRLRSLRVEPVDAPRRSMTIKADPKGPRDDIHRVMDLYLNAVHLPRGKMRITMATLQLTFMSDGAAKPRTMSFDISHPSSCNRQITIKFAITKPFATLFLRLAFPLVSGSRRSRMRERHSRGIRFFNSVLRPAPTFFHHGME